MKVDLLGTSLVGSSASTTLGVGAVDLLLLGAGSLNATGNAGDNSLSGTVRNNVLDGAGRADTLIGGRGQDSLTGGLGADDFVFNHFKDSVARGGRDHIVDFSSAEDDIIDLSAIDANRRAAGDQDFHFIGGRNSIQKGTTTCSASFATPIMC